MSDDQQAAGPKTYLASAHLHERRESRREVKIEIEVDGTDGNGQIFRERTFTRNVSEWGCQFAVSTELKTGEIVVVQVLNAETGERARQGMFQVMRVEREGDRWVVGAWKLDGGDIWGAGIEKPGTPDESDRRMRKTGSAGSEKVGPERSR